jgi:hypothetical protein
LTTKALRRIGDLYAIEEAIRGEPPDVRLANGERGPDLSWAKLRAGCKDLATLSRKSDTAAAIAYAFISL